MRLSSTLALAAVLLTCATAHASEPDRVLHSPGLAAAGSALGTVGAVGVSTGIYFALTHEPCSELGSDSGPAEAIGHAACVGSSDVPAQMGIIGLIAGGASFLVPAIPMMLVGYWPSDAWEMTIEVGAGRLSLDVTF